jgi:AcrR family transcriptional regulator
MTGTMTRPPDQPAARPADQLRADARQNHALLITAATAAFTEKGADAPLEDIARRAGVGIGTLYRHFPSRLDLQAAVFRTQVRDICEQGDALPATGAPEEAFSTWVRALAGYLVIRRGLSRALIDAVGVESELITSCWIAGRGHPGRCHRPGRDAADPRGRGELGEGTGPGRSAADRDPRRPDGQAGLTARAPRGGLRNPAGGSRREC